MRYLASILILFLTVSCTSEDSSQRKSADSSAQPVSISEAQFQSLEWLKGTWHGKGGKSESFYEIYQFVNDTTIKFEVFSDSSFTEINYKGRITFSDNTVTYKSGPNVWKATSIGDDKVYFEPFEKVKNTITWTKKSSDKREAVLRYPKVGAEDYVLKYSLKRISN